MSDTEARLIELFDGLRNAEGGALICGHFLEPHADAKEEVVDRMEVPVVCLAHPAAGLLCKQCFEEHAGRTRHHYPCVRCGAPGVHQGAWSWDLERDQSLPVHTMKGITSRYFGSINVFGYWSCEDCHPAILEARREAWLP